MGASAADRPVAFRDPFGPGPLVAAAMADAMLRYWKHCGEQGRLDPSQPLDIVDIVPGSPDAALQLLRALDSRVNAALGEGWSYRLLSGHPDAALPASWRKASALAQWIDRGVLVPLASPPRGSASRGDWTTGNPLVLMSCDGWKRLDQQLLAVHYGKLLEGDLQALSGTEERDGWAPLAQPCWPDGIADVIDGYIARLNSAPVVFPHGAMRALEAAIAGATRGCLLLMLDDGIASEHALRLVGFERVLDGYRKSGTLPVNFHLLGAWLRARGHAVWHREVMEGRVLQIAAGGPDAGRALDAVVSGLECASLAGASELSSLMETVVRHGSSSQALAVLRHARHDPGVFAVAGSALCRLLQRQTVDRRAWSEALAEVWSNHVSIADGSVLHRHVARVAMEVSNWSFARRVLRQGIQVHGAIAMDLVMLALCHARTGRLEQARSECRRALGLEPSCKEAVQLMDQLNEKASRLDSQWRQRVEWPDSALMLEPLDIDHAAELLHQYRDPQIAVMTGLPPVSTLQGMREWIAEQTNPDGHFGFAVVHDELGLVGYVSVRVSMPAAHFCFWIGVDHQGHGFGTQAGRMLCDFILGRGVEWIFSSAFNDNVRSLRSLERIGFRRMAVRPADPTDARTFVCFAKNVPPGTDAKSVLLAFMERIETPLQLASEGGDVLELEDAA